MGGHKGNFCSTDWKLKTHTALKSCWGKQRNNSWRHDLKAASRKQQGRTQHELELKGMVVNYVPGPSLAAQCPDLSNGSTHRLGWGHTVQKPISHGLRTHGICVCDVCIAVWKSGTSFIGHSSTPSGFTQRPGSRTLLNHRQPSFASHDYKANRKKCWWVLRAMSND